MRILDVDTDRSVRRAILYLTESEARQAVSYLEQLLADQTDHHKHLHDDSYERELILTIYGSQNMDSYDGRSRRLIEQDS